MLYWTFTPQSNRRFFLLCLVYLGGGGGEKGEMYSREYDLLTAIQNVFSKVKPIAYSIDLITMAHKQR